MTQQVKSLICKRVLKYSRVNAGAHLAEAQRLAAAYLQEGLDNPKS